ncbi:LysE family transporter [Mesorhizobium sp. M0217]|uniref:LysE family translocator n=1 Tax=unclassified Mesorhizobium TaxID=325217 RepID=UPI003334BDA4
MFTVITNGVARGFLRAFVAGMGIAAGDAVLVTLALLGLVALAQTFEWVFLLLKYAGAAYLIFLGIKMWRAAAAQSAAQGIPKPDCRGRSCLAPPWRSATRRRSCSTPRSCR